MLSEEIGVENNFHFLGEEMRIRFVFILSIVVLLVSQVSFAVEKGGSPYEEMRKIAIHPRIMELLRAGRSETIYVDERVDYFLAFTSTCSLRVKLEYSGVGDPKFMVSRNGCGSKSEIKKVRALPKTWVCTGSGAGRGPSCFRALKSI